MKIVAVDFVKGAVAAEGVAVIIDVFRAFSVVCYAFSRGAERIIPVAAVEDAFAWKEKEPDALMIGERHAKKIPGFDFGNSPTEIKDVDLEGRTLIHTTHAGTQGLVSAAHAEEVLSGSLVNAAATAKYIKAKNPKLVTLVRMGFEACKRTDEDDICASYIETLLKGEPYDVSAIPQTLRGSPCSARFFDPAQPWNPPSDFELCVDVDRFDFVVKRVPYKDGVALVPRSWGYGEQ